MYWNPNRQRTTIRELALYYHVNRNKMARMLKRAKVDLSDIGSILEYAENQVAMDMAMKVQISQAQEN